MFDLSQNIPLKKWFVIILVFVLFIFFSFVFVTSAHFVLCDGALVVGNKSY
jgi:hypothetical protein